MGVADQILLVLVNLQFDPINTDYKFNHLQLPVHLIRFIVYADLFGSIRTIH